MALDLVTLAIGAAWMAAGVVLYVVYRRRQRLPLTQTVKIVTPEPLGVEEVEYRSVLLAFEDEPFSPETVATAARLAARRARGIHVVSLLNVPTHLPLDAPLDAEESKAQSKIEQAKLIAGMRVTGHVVRVRPGQAGHTIADEARSIDAAAIVMQLRYRNGTPLYGKTLQTVLAERPTRVIVSAEPEVVRAGGDGAGSRVPIEPKL
jgi:APA family basic amino acid/polyamine antiporter